MIKFSKRKKVWLSVIIGVLLLAIAASGIFFVFFDKSVVGSWSLKDGSSTAVLIFSRAGQASVYSDSIRVDGTYEVLNQDTLKIEIKTGNMALMNGEYKYEVIKENLSKTLKLTNPAGEELEYIKNVKEEIKGEEGFSPVNGLIGIWENKTNGFEYEFSNTGITIFRKNNLTVILTYTADDTVITFTQRINGNDRKNKVNYTLKDDVLTLNKIEFTKKG